MAVVASASPVPTSTVHDLFCSVAQPKSQDLNWLRAAHFYSTCSAVPAKAAVTPWVGRACSLPRLLACRGAGRGVEECGGAFQVPQPIRKLGLNFLPPPATGI